MAFPWAAALSAVSGIASLFGGKKETSNRVNYKQMVADAEAAGFNPLTVLRNGGSAGYMQTAHPALSAGEVVGGALGHVGSFLADFDPMADDKRELEAELVRAQIANLNSSTAALDRRSLSSPGSFNVPQKAAGQVEGRPSGHSGALSGDSVPVASWLAPPKVTSDALPVWVPGVDRDGRQMWIPNPDGPDVEQLAFGLLSRSQSGWEAAANAALSPDVRVTKEKPKKAEQSSWWDYVPSFELRWE